MVALVVDRALLVLQDLVELVLRLSCFLAMWAAVNIPDDVVWLALACEVPLVADASLIIDVLPIVIVVMAGEAAELLFLLVCLVLHHVT